MKKGISLIVLVITIIVMIIIAGAIILSLNSSNVTGRAKLSTLSSDRASYKAQYAVAYANAMAVLDNDGQDVSVASAFKIALNGTGSTNGVESVKNSGTYLSINDPMEGWTISGETATKTVGQTTWTITSTGEVTAQVSSLAAYGLDATLTATGETYSWVTE